MPSAYCEAVTTSPLPTIHKQDALLTLGMGKHHLSLWAKRGISMLTHRFSTVCQCGALVPGGEGKQVRASEIVGAEGSKMRVFCESLGVETELPERPERIVCLASSLTETLCEMGLGQRIAGISRYCARYTPLANVPVVGDYLRVDKSVLASLDADLIILTTGIQRPLGIKLSQEGYPVYALPLPSSLSGVMENVNVLGGLVNEVESARRLRQRWEQQFQTLYLSAPLRRPRVYIELWFGRHLRTVGALSFVHDLVEAAGGNNIFGRDRRAYFIPDLEQVAALRPDVLLFHTEPEHPVDVAGLIEERGWHRWNPAPYVVVGTVEKGQNIIHEGPSMMETATWLQGHFHFWARHYR